MKVVLSTILVLIGCACLAQAPADLQKALEKRRAGDDLSGWIYDQLQWVAKAPASRCPQLVRAEKEAWRRPHTPEEMQAWQDLLINEGYSLLQNGSIVPSTDAYVAAYNWTRQHSEIADEALVLENILKPLGNNYTRLGDYEQALFIHRKALSLALAGQDKQTLAGVYSNLANTSSNMGQPQQALDYCRQGLNVVDGHSALAGLLLSEQADAAMQIKHTDEAKASISKSIAVLERALARKENPAAGYWLLMAYQQAGDIYGKSMSYYMKALRLQERLQLGDGGTRRRERAKLWLRVGNLDQCLDVLLPGKTFATLRESDLFAENTLVDLLFVRAGFVREQGMSDEALRLYRLSFAAESKLRREFISGSSREQAISDTRSRYEQAIAFAWKSWDSTRDKKYLSSLLGFMESSKSQLLLEEVRQQQRYSGSDSIGARIRLLEKALSYYEKEALGKRDSALVNQEYQINWELAQLRKKVPGGMEKIAASTGLDSLYSALGKGVIARSFFCGSDALYTVECTSSGISFGERLPLGVLWQDSLRTFIHTWFEQGAGPMIDKPMAYYRQAYALYRDLFGLHPFQSGGAYILFTDGALNLLPVEALVTSADGKSSPAYWSFVIGQNLISYGWSLQTLKEQAAGEGKGFSAFFLSGNLRSSPYLKATEAERKGIREIVPGGDWFIDGAATTGAFRKALSSSAVLHISSHAFTQKDSLALPHIELFDSSFYLFELKGLEHQPGLVVLSACRTGDGRVVTGEGVQSLARAFTGGGAKAVIAGWWNVNDEAAAKIMQEFYKELGSGDSSGGKENAARALRAAKLIWLKDPAVPYLHKLPYYWAALNYQGNPQPLKEDVFAVKGRSLGWWPVLLLFIVWVLYRVRRLYTRV
ncbi:MAG: CHAT domain-containing protein [Bacteroidetes bacterium]|nr:CHAT domain-containing protein [Bacteroidota bacterium]